MKYHAQARLKQRSGTRAYTTIKYINVDGSLKANKYIYKPRKKYRKLIFYLKKNRGLKQRGTCEERNCANLHHS